MTIVINTKNKDLGLILPLLIEYPWLRFFIMKCYEENNLTEMYDFLIGVDCD